APSGKSLEEVEKDHILNVLNEAGGNYSKAARTLGISRVTLYNKIRTFRTSYRLGVNEKRWSYQYQLQKN
ncbi:unnamed protein product, partial [marine sediment metagenome]